MKGISSKSLFISLSLLSIGSLIGSFGYPLVALEVWKQSELSTFNVPITRTYILTSNDRNLPFGFDRSRAKRFAIIHQPYTVQKILLLATSIGTAITALSIGKNNLSIWESEDALRKLDADGIRELREKAKRHEFAMRQKLQHYIFQDELAAMLDEFSSTESQQQEIDELLTELDDRSTPEDNDSPPQEQEEPVHDFRGTFPEQMDSSSWKAIIKALSAGASRDEAVRDVLGGGSTSAAYFDYLKSKYL